MQNPIPMRSARRRFPSHPRSVLRRFGLLSLALTGVVSLSLDAAADCGDDVAGQRVACVCGDVVVASVRFQPSDPVLTQACSGDGLVVRPPTDGSALVIDLNGQELVGAGAGTGIRVLPGGAAGIEILGGIGDMRATIRGFRDGIRALADGALGRVVNVTVSDSGASGVRVRGSGTRLEGVRVERSGGDGVRTSGRTVDLVGVETEGNARRGVAQHAHGGVVELESTGNGVVDRLGRAREGSRAGSVAEPE